MMLGKKFIYLLTITFTIAGCFTDQHLEQQSTDIPLEPPPDNYSIDASIKGSFDGEWYISPNNQFSIKPPKMTPIIHIEDLYLADSKAASVTFKSKDAPFSILVCSAEISEGHNYDAMTSIYEKAYGENIEGDCIIKRTAISVFGEQGITYLLGYVGQDKHYVTKPSITSIFEKNGYFYQVIVPSTLSFGPDSADEQHKILERNMNELLNNIEFTK